LPFDPSSSRTAPNQTLPGTRQSKRFYGVMSMHGGLTPAYQADFIKTARMMASRCVQREAWHGHT
jgi:hypothetical protein